MSDTKNKKTNIFVFAAIFATLAGMFVRHEIPKPLEVAGPSQVIDFNLPDLEDKAHGAAEWRGKVQVVNFWATWCGPCLHEIPEFIKLQTEYQAQGLQFVGIAIDDKAAVADYVKRVNTNYPMLIAGDGGMGLSMQFGNSIGAVPFTVIINAAGEIVHRFQGEMSAEELLKTVKPLLAANKVAAR